MSDQASSSENHIQTISRSMAEQVNVYARVTPLNTLVESSTTAHPPNHTFSVTNPTSGRKLAIMKSIAGCQNLDTALGEIDYTAMQLGTKAIQNIEKDPSLAIDQFLEAYELFKNSSHFSAAAQCQEHIARFYAKQKKFVESIRHYELAVQNYEKSKAKNAYAECRIQMAHVLIENHEFERAFTILDSFVKENTIEHWNARLSGEAFLATLCLMTQADLQACRDLISEYSKIISLWTDSYQYRILNDIIQAIEKSNLYTLEKLFKTYYDVFPNMSFSSNLTKAISQLAVVNTSSNLSK